MTIKTILAGASGGTASNGTLELALALARRFAAHLEVLHVRTDVREILMASAGSDFMGTSFTNQWIDQVGADIAETASKVKRDFAAAALRQDLPLDNKPGVGPSAYFNDVTGVGTITLPERARFFDLAVLGRSERVVDRASSDVIEQTLLHSGRPVLLAPAKMPSPFGEVIAIGWDGSPQAVRAVTMALPFLVVARKTHIVTVGDQPDSDPASLVAYLARHGVPAKHRAVAPVERVRAGAQLLSTAREEGADLLVMGGYGHSPWREFIFGGATNDLLARSLLPLFLVH